MLFRIVAILTLFSYCTAYMTVGPISHTTVDVNKPEPAPIGVHRSPINAQRFAAGMLPKTPRALEGMIPTRSRHRVTRTHNRCALCASPSPLVFPPRPAMNNPITLLSNTDDTSRSVDYNFNLQIFGATGTTLHVSANGVVFLGSASDVFENGPLPSTDIPPNAILPFWDDLVFSGGYTLTGQSDATSLTLRWNAHRYPSISVGLIDFKPGVWFVYYDSFVGAGDGSSATVGAQNEAGLYTHYSYNTAFVTSGLVLAIDTSCNGGSKVVVGPEEPSDLIIERNKDEL